MRRKNWVMPGILMLSVLLLLSFPVIATAEENDITEPVVVNDETSDEPAVLEQAAIDQQSEESNEQLNEQSDADAVSSTDVVEIPKDHQPTADNNDDRETPTEPQPGKELDEPVVDEPVLEKPVKDKPLVDEPVLEKPVMDKPLEDELVLEKPVKDEPAVEEPDMGRPEEAKPNPMPALPDGNDSSNKGDGSVMPLPPVCGLPSATELDGNQSVAPSATVPGDNQNMKTDNDWNQIATAVSSGTNEPESPFVSYLVRKGESLWLIGKNFGVHFLEIMNANNLKDYLIYPDQELIIPGVTTQDGKVVYRIKPGDTFYLIAKALGLDYIELMKLNGYDDIWIYPEDTLLIPEKTESAAALLSSDISEAKAIIAEVGSDLELLARAIYAEARGESFEGQVAVGAVILNRLKASGFPKTIRDIIYQPGAFTAVDDGQIALDPDTVAFRAAQKALDGDDPSLGALYYWNPDIATSTWIWSRPIIKQIGNHVFAR